MSPLLPELTPVAGRIVVAFKAAISVTSGIVVVTMLFVIVLVGLVARSQHRIRESRRDRQAGRP